MIRTFFIYACMIISLSVGAQIIPNSSFEEWEDEHLFDDPQGFSSRNYFSVVWSTAPNVTKVDGVNNSSAVRVESVRSLVGPLFGYLANNRFNQGIEGGQAFTSIPDTFSGYIRQNIMEGDSGLVAIIFKKDGRIISSNYFSVIGTSEIWRHFEVELSPFSIIPDSMLFIVQSSTGRVQPGSFIELCQLRFNSADQLRNNNFEFWRDIRYVNPVEWTSINFINDIYDYEQSVSRTDDAFDGNWATRIESVWSWSSNDTTGLLYSSDQLNDVDGFSINTMPSALRGYYKYFPVVPTDLAFVAIEFRFVSENNSERQDTIFIMPLEPVNEYTQFNFDISGINMPVPDTAKIYFLCTDAVTQNSRSGSVLYIDKLDFIPLTEITTLRKNELLKIHPNPVYDWININSNIENASFVIYNSNGNIYKSGVISNSSQRIDVLDLPSGKYNLAIYGSSNAFGSFVKIK